MPETTEGKTPALGDAQARGLLAAPLGDTLKAKRDRAILATLLYQVREYTAQLWSEIGAHSLRATAATNALDHQADIAKVQEWLGHANISTTRIYDRCETRSEDSPTFKVIYYYDHITGLVP